MMTRDELYKTLDYVNATREQRLKYAKLILKNSDLIPKIMDIIFEAQNKISDRAAWILEYVARENLDTILPHLEKFTSNMHKVKRDPAVRPIAKICECLTAAFFSKSPNKTKALLKTIHKERIIEIAFHYLISDQKIATQVYSMNTLFLLGREFDWIHPELISTLERDYPKNSPGYKARARNILKKLKK